MREREMATTKQEQIESLFGKLDTQLRNRQTKRALKTTDEILKLAPRDTDALHVKATLLIDQGSAAEALQLIDSCDAALAKTLAFERAHCIYRLGRLQEALEALNAVGPDRAAASLQLAAQLQYRLGNHAEAIELYSQLLREHPGLAQSQEVRTNAIAAYAVGGRAAEIPAAMASLKASPRDNFELAFNAACGLVEQGQLAATEDALTLAWRVGEESLYDEELGEEEVTEELAPVAAQLAYLQARTGKLPEAADALQRVLKSGDPAVVAVAATDLAAVLLRLRAGDRKAAGEGLRALEPAVERNGGFLHVKSTLASRLGASHCEAVLSAYASTALAAGKMDVAREAVRSLAHHHRGSTNAALLQTALLSRDGKGKEAAAALAAAESDASAGSPEAVAVRLARAQLEAARGDAAAAAALLGELPAAHQGQPAVTATRSALLEQGGDLEGAARVARSALEPSSGGESYAATRWALRRLAALNARQGNVEAAAADLVRLASEDSAALEDPELLRTLPRLVACCRPTDAPQLAAKLPAVVALLSAAEVDALESAGVTAGGGAQRRAAAGGEGGETAAAAAAGEKRKAGDGDDEKEKRKRKRKKRLPKGFDPANPGPPPDPERWLPKWQRSDAKKARKKRKNADATKGSQGAGKVDASLDASSRPVEKAAEKAAPAKGGSNKKKGKGRR